MFKRASRVGEGGGGGGGQMESMEIYLSFQFLFTYINSFGPELETNFIMHSCGCSILCQHCFIIDFLGNYPQRHKAS